MKDNYRKHTIENCIHCGRCTKNCKFLEKYNMDLADYSGRKDLSYNCFMCGMCNRVCPKDLDGRRISLEHRKDNPHGFNTMRFLKTPYKFSNNSRKKFGDLIFFGCNFTGYFPKTTKEIAQLCMENGDDFSIDCCGKPVYESGDKIGSEKIADHLNLLFEEKEISRLVAVCPNCYYYLKDKIHIPIITIYEKLQEMGKGNRIKEMANIFIPCPDKQAHRILETIKPYLQDHRKPFNHINCCGMGGLACKREKSIADGFIHRIKECNEENIYTYCGTCAGHFNNCGLENVHHILSEIMGINEAPSKTYVRNIVALKYYGRKRK